MALGRLGFESQRGLRGRGARLLNEFLVSLGLFFLILTAALVILGNASRSISNAAVTREALAIAREGMEELVATASPDKPMLRQENFAGRENSASFQRMLRVTPLSGDSKGLALLRVVVEWEDSDRKIRLERYVTRI